MLCPCRFIDCNKVGLQWGVLIIEEAVHEWRWRVYRKFLYFLLDFAVNLNCLKFIAKKTKQNKKKNPPFKKRKKGKE
jgi:hypothetical protein